MNKNIFFDPVKTASELVKCECKSSIEHYDDCPQMYVCVEDVAEALWDAYYKGFDKAESENKMNETQKLILDYLQNKENSEFLIASSLKLDRKLVSQALRQLIKKDMIEEFRSGINQTRCYRIKN